MNTTLEQNLLEQLKQYADTRIADFSCCSMRFEKLYYFRKHIYENHQDIYDHLFGQFVLPHKELIHEHCPSSKRPGGKKSKKGRKTGKRNSSSKYSYNADLTYHFRIISIPMGGAPKK